MFLNVLKMIVRRCPKKGFVTFLVTGLLLITTVKFFLELAQLEEAYVLQDMHFVESDMPKNESYLKSTTSSTNELHKSKINAKKDPSVSNCVYHVLVFKSSKSYIFV